MSKLLEQLTELDKKRIHNFITTWGCPSEDFIGVDEYLEQWAKHNTKLYHLLGNNISISMPFNYEKDQEELREDCEQKLYRHPFYIIFRKYIREELPNRDTSIGWTAYEAFTHWENVAKNIFPLSFKVPNVKTGGTLQVQKGGKYIKTMNRIFDADPAGFERVAKRVLARDDFFDDEESTEFENKSLEELKQDFINKHSAILNDKRISCTLTISIHPLDYITMSDNGNDWESCMSWKHDGCYHQGTVEMMNSNMVLCCFLHNDKIPWNFSSDNEMKDHEGLEEWLWNNKKYRQLIYVTKDIIVSGKSYPYANDEISQKIITAVKDLAMQNMQWTYSFGPERYQDMKWINGSKSMIRAKGFARKHEEIKHNVIIETNAMYNDFVRDSGRHYWCYRNKVQHTKVINASGPATCLCCHGSVTDFSGSDWDYFERFSNTSMVICAHCRPKLECNYCNNMIRGKKYHMINKKNGETEVFCRNCIQYRFAVCHCCGQWFESGSHSPRKYGAVLLSTRVPVDEKLKEYHFDNCVSDYCWITKFSGIDRTGIFIPLCPHCLEQKKTQGEIEELNLSNFWGTIYNYYFFKERRDFTEEEFNEWRAKLDMLPEGNEVFIDF